MREPAKESKNASLAAAQGGVVLISAQLIIALVGVVQSGIVSRLLSPASFGQFTVALSAMGLVALVLTSGLPSAVLGIRSLTPALRASVVIFSILAGLVASVILLVGALPWELLWRSEGSSGLIRLLAINAVILSPAVVQLALLRRENRPTSDAITQVAASVTGAFSSIVLVVYTQQTWALVVNQVVVSFVTLLISFTLRRERVKWTAPTGWSRVLRFSGSVSYQTALFWALTNVPIWAVSFSSNPDVLGQYSRAWVVVGIPGTAIASALARALQPHYRRFKTNESASKALLDSLVLITAFAATVFGLTCVLSNQIVRVWLGPGWEDAADFLQILGPGFGAYTLFTVVANFAEMHERFSEVRWAQAAMAIPAIILAAIAVLRGTPAAAAWIMLAIALVGLLVLMSLLAAHGALQISGHIRDIAVQLVISLAIVVAAGTAAYVLQEYGDPSSIVISIVAAAVAVAVASLLNLATWKFQPSRNVLDRRGIQIPLPWKSIRHADAAPNRPLDESERNQ